MPSHLQAYEVLLEFMNDTIHSATVQLLRDYGRNSSAIVLLHPGDTVTLVLDAGSVYRYALKQQSKVANVTARLWRDSRSEISPLFVNASSSPVQSPTQPTNGLTVDCIWRDYRMCIWNDS